jgi:hypothetical protein
LKHTENYQIDLDEEDSSDNGIGYWKKKLMGITKPEIKEEGSFMTAT